MYAKIAQFVRFLQVSWLLLRLVWVIYRERSGAMRTPNAQNGTERAASERLLRVLRNFRNTAPKLGVLMVKFGQFLSSRVDLLPEDALAILCSLQDDIPPEPFEHVVFAIESELGKPVSEVFSLLEPTCTAAASLGQVHKAVLAATGEIVAVKIQRPNTDELVRMDLRALKFVIWVITHLLNLSSFVNLMDVYDEFERTIYQELNYVQEAANARRFKEMFKDDPLIYIPRVYEQYVTRHLLVLEWIDGIKITDYAALEAAGVSRLEVVKRTVYAYFYQFFEAGFFHADPHPGNIFVKKGSKGDAPIITFVDFGMMSSLTKGLKKSLKEAFIAFVAQDPRSLVRALTRLGFIGEGANLASIEQALAQMIERYHGMTLGEIHKADIFEMVQDAAQLFYGQPFHIPAQFAFTGRAMSTLVGISTELAPEFNFLEIAAPYARKFLGPDVEDVEHAVYQLCRQLWETSRSLFTLPGSLEQLVVELKQGQHDVSYAGRHAGGHTRNRNEYGRFNVALLFIFSLSMASGLVLLVGAHLLFAGWFCLGLAAVTTLKFLLKS